MRLQSALDLDQSGNWRNLSGRFENQDLARDTFPYSCLTYGRTCMDNRHTALRPHTHLKLSRSWVSFLLHV
jgi:hypothetical protein